MSIYAYAPAVDIAFIKFKYRYYSVWSNLCVLYIEGVSNGSLFTLLILYTSVNYA